MKKTLTIIFAFALSFNTWAEEQRDTMFVHIGQTVHKFHTKDVDSITPNLGVTQDLDSLYIYKGGTVTYRFRVDDVERITFVSKPIDSCDVFGHNFLFTHTTDPDCDEPGFDLYTCPRCEETEERNVVVALAAPKNLQIAGTTLTWDAVANATGYVVDINDTAQYNTTDNSFDLSHLTRGGFILRVKASGDDSIPDVYCWSEEKIYSVFPPPDQLTYEDYLGAYIMWFNTNTNAPQSGVPRLRNSPVVLEQAVYGETYYLTGILGAADLGQGKVIVNYNAETGRIELWGQKLFDRASTVFYLSPEGRSSSERIRSNPTNARERGVASANCDYSQGFRFDMVHIDGTWGSNRATGFILENFPNDQSTENGTVISMSSSGTGFNRMNYLIFEKDLRAEINHNYQYKSTTAPTCEKVGFHTYVCTSCWQTKRDTIYALGKPQNLEITGTTLTWDAVVDSDVTGYIVSINGTLYPETTELSFDLSALNSGVYTIKVKATGDSLRDADCWAEIRYVTGGVQLPAPTNLRIDGTVLTWETVDGAIGYDVLVDNCGQGRHAASNSFDLSFLPIPGTYTITVAANGDGETTFHSTWSEEINYTASMPKLTYEDFLGTYIMWFTNSNSLPAPTPRPLSVTVTLEKAIAGETYFVKGILNPDDEALGNIIATYNATTGHIEIHGQHLFRRDAVSREFWLTPEGRSIMNHTRSTPVNASERGMVSSNYDLSGGLKFEMIHLGETPGSTVYSGFELQNFISNTQPTNGSTVDIPTPAIGVFRFNHLIFVKQ